MYDPLRSIMTLGRQSEGESHVTQTTRTAALAMTMLVLLAAPRALAQPPATPAPSGRGGPQPPQYLSPEVGADRTITFRIFAPNAGTIRLTGSDIPGLGQGTLLTKGEGGVWQVSVGPVPAGAYRYSFNVDGVATIDPRNSATSESNNNVWSLVNVPGSDVMDLRDVPHGAVAEVHYYSTTLGAFRRMHVYTPPGYESGGGKYPVFYLLHGAGDSDDAWTTVGRAGVILDNLIAAGRAKPMVVVMPAGHTRRGPAAGGSMNRTATEEFVNDFLEDVVPLVRKRYRVLTDRNHTAIAGLSMGGNHSLQVAIPNLERFGYIGIYSSGLLGMGRGRGAPPAAELAAEWEKRHAAKLDDPGLKRGLKLFWFSTGKEDFLLESTRATVELFRKHGFTPVYKESDGGHTWLNWRAYLIEFAPQLFK
jgi:enterochelin esterase-like enzyme